MKDHPLQSEILDATLNFWSQTNKHHFIPITGNSMWPLIRDGDQIFVRHGNSHLRRGDIVLFRQNTRLLAHRIIRLDTDRVITKGDNNRHVDPPLNANEILGRVMSIKRGTWQINLDQANWRLVGSHINAPISIKLLRSFNILARLIKKIRLFFMVALSALNVPKMLFSVTA